MVRANKKLVALVALFIVGLTVRSDAALVQWPADEMPSRKDIDLKIPKEAVEADGLSCPQNSGQCPVEQNDSVATFLIPNSLTLPFVVPDSFTPSFDVPSSFTPPFVDPKPPAPSLAVPKPPAPPIAVPKAPTPPINLISMGASTLAPMAHSMFCAQYPRDCEGKALSEVGSFEWTSERWKELESVNAVVNRSIRPQRNLLGLAGEQWIIKPRSGDCNDYAVTKRHELLARGWPPSLLLLAEVVVPSGEHHLILVVRTEKGHVVLDNLTADLRVWVNVPYRWIRIQSDRNPKHWKAVERDA